MTTPDTIDFRIIGEDLQAVIVTLDPGEAVVAEAGAMMYMQQGIEMGTQMSMKQGGGLLGKLFEAGKRALTGDSFFVTYFTNNYRERQDVAFAAPYPGRIVPVELGDYRGTLICQKDSFLCAARGVNVDIAFNRRIGTGLFGGEGFILQKLSSPSGRGQAFLHAGGTILTQTLRAGEVLRVDTGCLVAFEPSVDYDIQMVPGFKNMLFGGEGLFFAQMTGPGTVWLQTLPFSRLADRIHAASPAAGGRRRDEGSVLGGLGGLLDGDNRY
ncbi:MAG TPA: TIGR00266 family protein [Phycisphaerales bacterium]|nr:TIGR00266 family protein [Phycisphaerales bacterium]